MPIEFAVTKRWLLNTDLAWSTRYVFGEDGESMLESGEGDGASANGTVVGMEQNMPRLEISEVHIQTSDTEMWNHRAVVGAERK